MIGQPVRPGNMLFSGSLGLVLMRQLVGYRKVRPRICCYCGRLRWKRTVATRPQNTVTSPTRNVSYRAARPLTVSVIADKDDICLYGLRLSASE